MDTIRTAEGAGMRPRIPQAAAGAAPEARSAPPTSKPKTAVIVVHGMGEQRPLETIRSFVEGVYQADLSKATKPMPSDGMLEVSIVPDSAFNSAELRRLTTHDDGPAKRTDFFEFYWADIMDGTQVEMVTSWIDGLLLRSPWRVPAHWRVYLAWLLLWALALVFVFCLVAVAYPPLVDHVPILNSILKWINHNGQILGKVFYVGGALLLAYTIIRGLVTHKIETTSLQFPVLLLVAGAVLALWPPNHPLEPHVLAAGVTAGVGWFMHNLAAPYLGDVVRYVRATPSTVERRKLVRQRGLELLEAVHAKRADSTDLDDFVRAPMDDPPAYDRIVLVSHSLGTYVAYDMLQLFWEKYGPTHHQTWLPGRDGVQDALEAVDAFVQTEWVKGQSTYPLADYLAAQAALNAQLVDEAPQWRITDFITLGSPLVHAEFLATDGTADLEESFAQRRFATCPPRPDPLLQSALYSTVRDGPKYLHFAAQFAAVKWTNICDESLNPILGDLVSGRLRPIFGHGIDEYMVKIKRPHRVWPFNRVFTHTEYWSWDESFRTALPDHLRLLRAALRLGD